MSLPRRFGRYLLMEKLATGGMAEIYEARLLGVAGFEKALALKQILPYWSQNADFAAMLIDEAKIAVRINHPNIVQVYELGREEEQHYIAMELVSGVDLRSLQQAALLAQQPIPLNLCLWIISEVSQALHYAHNLSDDDGSSLEIVHRDISPQNILVSYQGDVKVTDFGIARATGRQHETVTGTFKGKFAYMSPEQANQAALDHRSDLFSLGIVFYELVTGKRLFVGGSDVKVLDQVRSAKISQDEPAFQALPQRIQKLVLTLLSKNPAQRPQQAQEIVEEIENIAQEQEYRLGRQVLKSFLESLLGKQIKHRRSQRAQWQQQVADFSADATQGISLAHTRSMVQQPVAAAEGTVVLVEGWKAKRHKKPTQFIMTAMFYGLLLLITALLGSIWWGRQSAPPVKENMVALREPPPAVKVSPPEPGINENQVVPMQSAPVAPKRVESPKPIKSVAPLMGSLNVQATPWAYVYTEKNGPRHETPVRALELAAGKQSIQVVYPPTGKRLQRVVNIQGGKSVTCIARFGNRSSLSCR